MGFPEFQAGMLRLARTYGANAYPKERVDLFWDALEKFNGQVFTDAVTELIANELKPPMLKQILGAIDEELKRRARQPAERREAVPLYERSPETMAMLKALMERMNGKPQATEEEMDRHEKLRQQLRAIPDWKERQAGEREE
jgi:hypothetical protein